MNRWLPILLLGLAACADPLEPPAEFEYGVGFGTMAADPPAEPGVIGRRGEILINGNVRTPNGCQSLRGSVERDGFELVVHITARTRSVSRCSDASAGYAYQAMARGLDRGTYRVRIFHVYENVHWPMSKAFDREVTVR